MNRTIGKFLVLGIFATVGASAATLKVLDTKAVKDPPSFTLDMTMESYDVDGHLSVASPFRLAYRQDGSTMKENVVRMNDGSILQRKVIYDLEAGFKFVTSSIGRSVSSYELSPGRVRTLRDRKFECGNMLSKTDTVLGYSVVLERQDMSHAYPEAQSATAYLWHAPALGCSQLKAELVLTDADGNERFVTRTLATSVGMGEPNPSLFEVPGNYQERSPSEAIREINRRYPEEFPLAGSEAFLAQLDDAYWPALLGF